MNINNACSYCRALPATGRCGKCATLYCGRTCQRDDWLKGVHKTSCIGNKDDVYTEPRTRDVTKGPKQIAGPLRYSWYEFNGVQYWFFGERHDNKPTQWMKEEDGLDLSATPDGQVDFTGRNTEFWFADRLFYALGASAKRNNFKIDMYIEVQSTEMYKTRHDDDIMLLKMLSLFRSNKCLSLDRDTNAKCDFYPNARVHFADYRHMSFDPFFTIHGFVITYLSDVGGTGVSLPPQIHMLQDFVIALGDGWERRVYELHLFSDNYADDMFNWMKPIVEKTFSEGVANWFLTKLRNDRTTVTLVRKQYLRLRQEDEKMASMILSWVFKRATLLRLTAIRDVTRLYVREHLILAINQFVKATSLIMDTALLCRLFRSYADPSTHRFVYTGANHTAQYESFMREIGARARSSANHVDDLGNDVLDVESYVVLDHAASDELQKLLM